MQTIWWLLGLIRQVVEWVKQRAMLRKAKDELTEIGRKDLEAAQRMADAVRERADGWRERLRRLRANNTRSK